MRNKRIALAATSILAMTSIGLTDGASASQVPSRADLPPRDVTWTMDSTGCSLLPAGTVLNAAGVLYPEFTSKTKKGVTTEHFDDHAEGTATDQNGVVYTWTYDNELTERNSANSPTLFSGKMTDKFRLKTQGATVLSNGFEAIYVEDRVGGTFGIYPTSSYGDPFQFPSGPGRCDPL
jgi:hypothetical protein